MPTDPELFRFFDRSPIGMYRSDANGRLLVANPALAAMLGYDSVDEVLALDLLRDVYADPAERGVVLTDYKDSGFVEGRRVHWKTRTGRVLTVQLFGHVVETPAGLVFDATVIDLTEIDALEAEMQRQREEHELTARLLDTLMSQAPAMYYLVDLDFRVVRTGGAVEQILGFPADRYIGKTLHDAIANDPVGGDGDVIGQHQRAFAGTIVHSETHYRGKVIVNVIGPLRNASGEIVGAIGTSIDVTERRTLERRMIDAQRAESLGVLAGGLAHDFNNLLVAILGNADMALRAIGAGQPGHAAVEAIRRAGQHATELTDQLLAYAGRTNAGSVRVEPGLLVEELLRIIGPSIPDEVRVSVDVPTKLAVRGEPGQLRQVLLNLVNNARDALGSRGGTIAVRARELHTDGSPHPDDVVPLAAGTYVLLEISDDGPGMNAETRRHAFEPFFTTKLGGHGLGLAAVLGIVRTHGGGLRLTTAPDAGACFQVLWPAAVTGPISAVTPAATGARTVLVIDDEDLVRDVVARMVEDLGYATVTAADGRSGLEIVDRQTVDAVLVDLTMPRMSGRDVVAALRKRRPHLPLIVCSGYRDARDPIEADAFLPKPFRVDALERTLAKLLPLRSV